MESIQLAEKMLTLIKGEQERVQFYLDANFQNRKVIEDNFGRNQLMRYRIDVKLVEMWRREGRQTLAMNPDLMQEVTLATSDKIYPEVLRALPYLNPLVVFPGNQMVEGWGFNNERMRLLGYFTYSIRSMEDRKVGSLDDEIDWVFNTHDPDANHFGVMIIFDVLDEAGRVIDMEVSGITIPLEGNPKTLSQMAEECSNRYTFQNPSTVDPDAARKWMTKTLKVVIGSLCYLSSTVTDVKRVPGKAVAKRQNKTLSRKPLSLYNVGWTIGAALSKHRAQRKANTNPSQQGDPTHQQDPQHRKAHFKMQPYGPGRAYRRVCFISPYWTHRELLGLEGVNTARKVVS